jgi:predicted DCC family thiol-disulfide oxidoreductase YuxK
MKRLAVLYDMKGGFCVSCRHWLAGQPKFVEMDFLPARSAESARRLPGLEKPGDRDEVIVVGDDGSVWRGAKAFLMCLWALEEYRDWSLTLSRPTLLPLARTAVAIPGSLRKRLSSWLGLRSEESTLATLRTVHIPRCAGEAERSGDAAVAAPPGEGIPAARLPEGRPAERFGPGVELGGSR